MPLITKDSYIWTDTGVKPTAGDETATPGEQPIAEYHNWSMWAITNDIDKLNTAAGAHAARHANGGADELNLAGLSVGGGGTLTTGGADLLSLSTTGGTAVATLDTAAQRWTAFPPINPQLTLYGGLNIAGGALNTAGDITDGATLIYDSVNNALTEAVMPAGIEAGDYVERDSPSIVGPFYANEYQFQGLTSLNYNPGGMQRISFDTTAPTGGTSTNFRIQDQRNLTNVLEIDQNTIVTRRPINMAAQELQNFRVENRTNDPSSPGNGRFWIRTDI